MKNRTLVDDFKYLVDGYKIDKVTKLINGDSQSKNLEIRNGIKGFLNEFNPDGNEKIDEFYSNILDPVDLDDIKSSFFENYNFDFSDDFENWMEYQNSEEYKSQSLRTKITNRVKKEFPDQDIKEDVKRILDQYKLTYSLDSPLEIIKQGLDDTSIKAIEGQQVFWIKQLNDINEKYNYSNWLDWASSNAKNISFATHISKLTHSGISGASNIFFNKVDDKSYLSTASLKKREVEVSQSNNALSPIGILLQLRRNGESLSEQLKNGNLTVFEQFSKNQEQFKKWRTGFLAVFIENDLATHYLAKQTYFPINHNDHCDAKNYHLVNPMMSSSLDQAIFERVNFSKYSKEMVEIRKQKREGFYHQDIQVSYSNLATLKVTASNHGNAGSPLNGTRNGKRYLFPTTPPTWHAIQNPPLNQKSMFAGEFERRAWKAVKELQKYLIELQATKFGNKAIRDQVKQHINDVINILFDYVLDVQSMPAGWSEKSKLTEKHALWLDVNRDDKAFQEKRKSGQWQDDICQDFGLWMNSKLSHKKMKLVKFEKEKWAKLLKNRLSLFDKGWEKAQ